MLCTILVSFKVKISWSANPTDIFTETFHRCPYTYMYIISYEVVLLHCRSLYRMKVNASLRREITDNQDVGSTMYIHAYVHISVYMHAHARMHTHTHTHTHVHTCTRTHPDVHTHTHSKVYTWTITY